MTPDLSSAWIAPAARWGSILFVLGVSVAFLAFAVAARRGRPRTARVEKAGGSVVLSRYAMEYGLWVFGPVVRGAVRLGIHPDALSWASLVLQLGAAALVASGRLGGGAALFAVGAMLDAVDGAVARARGMASDAGEVLDAAVDRWGEMAVFFGLAWYYRAFWPGFLLAAGACAGAVMVSYTRAKAEAFGVDATLGLMQRHERSAWLWVAMVASSVWEAWHPAPAGQLALHLPVLVALGAIAGLANWTGWLRLRHTRRELRRR